MYLAGFLLLADALGLLVLLSPLRQVGVVGQTIEQRRHLRPSVHLLLSHERKNGGRRRAENKGGETARGCERRGREGRKKRKNRDREGRKWSKEEERRDDRHRRRQQIKEKEMEERTRHIEWLVKEVGERRQSCFKGTSKSIKNLNWSAPTSQMLVYFWL